QPRLQGGARRSHGRFGGLGDGGAVVGFLNDNVPSTDLAGQSVCSLPARGIVLCAVDAQTAGQTLHAGGQVVRSRVQILLSGQRREVSMNRESHYGVLMGWA